MTPDPYTNSGRLSDPQSWNRYAYTRGDPVNRYDPNGTEDEAPPSYCFDNPAGMFDPICTCPNGICNPPTGPGSGPELPPNVPCYQDWNKVTNALFDVANGILDIVNNDAKFTQTQIGALANALNTQISTELIAMALYSGNGPDLAFYQGGHFNLEISLGDLKDLLGNDALQEFQKDVLGRFKPDPGADGGALHGHTEVTRDGTFDRFHLDTDQATLDNPIGIAKHFGRDVMAGNFGTPCLDPAFNKP